MEIGARFRLDDGRHVNLTHEGIIGRMAHAGLRIDDPRISEAHAIVSLRGDSLKLLALRGRMSVDGKPRTEVPLAQGVRIVLAGFFGLTVESVAMPDHVLAVMPVGCPDEALVAFGVVSILAEAPRLRAGYLPEALGCIWTTATGPFLRVGETSRPLADGEAFSLGGTSYLLKKVARSAIDADATVDRGRLDARIHMTLLFDSVHIDSSSGRTTTLDGLAARALCELFAIGQPVAWQELARLLWSADDDAEMATSVLRQRWDQLLTRVRMKLREGSIRGDLIRSTGQGLVELSLGPHDTIDDRT